MQVSAIILGGGTIKENENFPKSLLEFEGRTLLSIAVDACVASKFVKDVCIVAPEKALGTISNSSLPSILKVESTPDLTENIFNSVKALNGEEYILIVSGDLPFITGGILDGFINECLPGDYGGYYPILEEKMLEEAYPGTKRTYAKLREGTFTGGNVFVVKKSVILANEAMIRKFFEARKNPLKLAMIAGLLFLLKAFFGMLSIEEAEERASRLVKAPLKAVRTKFPEIGIDIDKQADIEFARKYQNKDAG